MGSDRLAAEEEGIQLIGIHETLLLSKEPEPLGSTRAGDLARHRMTRTSHTSTVADVNVPPPGQLRPLWITREW